MTSHLPHQYDAQPHDPSAIGTASAVAPYRGDSIHAVSESRVSSSEFDAHLWDAERAYRTAYQRFEDYGCPQDRVEARALLQAMNEALRTRPGQVEAHAAFERRLLDNGLDYFQVQGAADRKLLGSRAA